MNESSPADHYRAAMDSVTLINQTLANPNSIQASELDRLIWRNAEHLRIIVAKNYWTDEDLTPLHEAIAASEVFAAKRNQTAGAA